MRDNRSVPPCAVIPVLIYPDPGAAAEWLMAAFGFRVRLWIANHRIQMRAGGGCVTLAEGTAVPNGSSMVQIRIEDAPAHCERARAAGALILTEVRQHVYGERRQMAVRQSGKRGCGARR